MPLKETIKEIINDAGSNTIFIAASKTRSASEIQLVQKYGISNFGENYVQEAESKKEAFKDVTLHMIGKLQSNKAKQAVDLFDVIHTVTSEKLACKLNKFCEIQNKNIDIFIQLNIAEEPQKNGISIQDIPNLVESIKPLKNLNLLGFMVVPPKNTNPEIYFKHAQNLTKQYGFTSLSMGMSGDYKEALKYGATHIRIGTAVFGERS